MIKRIIHSILMAVLIFTCSTIALADDTQIGDTYFHGDGSSTTQIDDTYFHNDGSSSTKIGDSMFNSDDNTKTYGW